MLTHNRISPAEDGNRTVHVYVNKDSRMTDIIVLGNDKSHSIYAYRENTNEMRRQKIEKASNGRKSPNPIAVVREWYSQYIVVYAYPYLFLFSIIMKYKLADVFFD